MEKLWDDAKVKRVAMVCGLAALWPSLFNQVLYPVTFTYWRTQDVTVYSYHIIYSLLLCGVVAALAIAQGSADRRLFGNPWGIAMFGVLGSLGVVFVSQLDFSSAVSTVGIGLGVGFVALYVATHFLFWCFQCAQAEHRGFLVDIAFSFALFGLVTGLRLLLRIHATEITIACPLVSGACAVILAHGQGAPRNTGIYTLRSLPLNFVLPCLVLIALCMTGIAVYNSQVLQPEDRAGRYVLNFAIAIAFAIVVVILRPGASNHRGSSIRAFIFVSLAFIAAALMSLYLGQNHLATGTLPLIFANVLVSGFVLIIVLRDANRMHASPTRVCAAYLVFVVVLPRMLLAIVMYQGLYLPVLVNSTNLFVGVATSAFTACAVAIVALMRFFTRTQLANAPEDELEQAQAEQKVFDKLRDAFGWSQRETEIAALLGQNMNAKQISEVQFIAESTVYTHAKRIYRKAGVHSKQELIDLIDEYRRS